MKLPSIPNKVFIRLLFLLLVILTVTKPALAQEPSNELVGVWKIDFQKTYNSVEGEVKSMLNAFSSDDLKGIKEKHDSWQFTFEENGSFSSRNDQGISYRGQWSFSGSKLRLVYSNGDKAEVKILELNNDQLGWQVENNSSIIFKKWFFHKVQ